MKTDKDNSLTDKEKRALRRRLMNSATNLNRKRKRNRYYILFGTAASVILLLGLFLGNHNKAEKGLQDFVDKTPRVDIKSLDKTTVVLGAGENIAIDSTSTVQYSPNGSYVDFGKGKVYNQRAVVNKKSIYNTILVPYGERLDVILSDGTHVWINSGSKLIFPAQFNENAKYREVYLEGKAIFDVAHNTQKPFKVLSENQEIEVLGTVFNVSAYLEDEHLETVLKSGRIKLTYLKDESKSFVIQPGTMSSLNVTTFQIDKYQVDVDDYFGWREGYLSLKREPLDHIVSKLSRYYNVEILIADEQLSNETFSGKLDLKDNISKVLENIKMTTKVKVNIEKDKIILTR